MSDFPKFQYSVFLKDSRDEQLVIRTDTFEELLEAKKDIDRIITKREYQEHRTSQTPNKTGTPIPVEKFEQTCNQCGGEKILNPKTGKYFCKAKCWLNR